MSTKGTHIPDWLRCRLRESRRRRRRKKARICFRRATGARFGRCTATRCRPATTPCGTNEKIQGYLDLVKRGKYLDAYALIKEDMPFPSVTGRVCYHPCEQACNRGQHTTRRFPSAPSSGFSATSDRPCRATSSRRARPMAKRSPSSDRVPRDTAPRINWRASATRSRSWRNRRKPVGSIAAASPTGCFRRTCSIARSNGSWSSASRSRPTPKSAKMSSWDDLKKNYDACVLAVGLTEPNSVRAEGEDKDGVRLRAAVPPRHRHGHVEGEAGAARRRHWRRQHGDRLRARSIPARRAGSHDDHRGRRPPARCRACRKICTTCSRRASS